MLNVRNGCTGFFLLLAILLGLLGTPAQALAQTSGRELPAITNLQQLTQTLLSERRVVGDVRLEVTVCAASRAKVGVVIVQDSSGVELLELGNFGRDIVPGEKLLIQGWYCLLRKRELGLEISANPVVDNDGLHVRRTLPGRLTVKAGWNPLRLDWFNCLQDLNLEVSCVLSNQSLLDLSSTNLCHELIDPSSGRTNRLPGLAAHCYEGYWEAMPDFNLLRPVKAGVVTNLDSGFRTRDEMVGLRFSGFFYAPYDGSYTFRLRSDDGSLLFVGKPELPLARLGFTNAPLPRRGFHRERMSSLAERRWTTVEGRVSFLTSRGEGLEFDLRNGQDVISVRVADAFGLDSSLLLNSQVRVTGVGRGILTPDQRLVMGKMFTASAKEVVLVQKALIPGQSALPITSAEQVQNLKTSDALRELPVHIRGVVTDARNSTYERWMSLQDDTHGIFVHLGSISNALPHRGECWEVVGHSGAGDFAPIVRADKVVYLGEGRMPEPARPTWRELANGSKDVQWAELKGLVTHVASNNVTLLLSEGRLEVQMDRHFEADLKPFLKTIVRIRGVLYALWNAETREVRVGSVMMRNATIGVDTPAPPDPFEAPVKNPRQLFLFDPQASDFQRVKVRGQVVYAEPKQLFLMQEGAGLRIMPAEPIDLQAGEQVQAVGYPEISGPSPLLREAVVRKTGVAPLPAAREIAPGELLERGLDSTRVLVHARLVGLHSELGGSVLEMQSEKRLFFARLKPGEKQPSLQVGSRLALTGVYVAQGSNRRPGGETTSFELLLKSPADILVLSKPSWWTLQRLLLVVGALLVILLLAAAWITLLRRKVEQRTRQLQHEIRERERAERQHAIEAERSRIARDLHDDLGSSLTEIGVLASTGQRPHQEETEALSLFRSIGAKARGLIAALDVIVWAVDPEDNSLQSLADYLSGFAEDFLSHSGLPCRFKVPISFPPAVLDGQLRHGVLLAVKESLNNIVRHADATEVEFRMGVVEQTLEIIIIDNGKGFEHPSSSDGHGLKNLPARLTKFGGSCQVESVPGQGTTVKMRLPLACASAQTAHPGDLHNTTFG